MLPFGICSHLLALMHVVLRIFKGLLCVFAPLQFLLSLFKYAVLLFPARLQNEGVRVDRETETHVYC